MWLAAVDMSAWKNAEIKKNTSGFSKQPRCTSSDVKQIENYLLSLEPLYHVQLLIKLPLLPLSRRQSNLSWRCAAVATPGIYNQITEYTKI